MDDDLIKTRSFKYI